MKHTSSIIFILPTLFLLLPLGVGAQESASLSISPPNGTYPVGESFTIEIRINTGGVAVGTADATIAYDPQDVTYVGLSDEGSVFSTILVDSTRETGRVDVSAFVERGQTPYAGSSGLIARMTFMSLRNVATEIRFSKGGATPPLTLGASVGSLANILSTLDSATYSFVPKERISATAPLSMQGGSIEITPLPATKNDWFSTSTITLSWEVPQGVTRVRTGVAGDTNTAPEKVYQTPVNTETLKDLREGKQYFLIQFEMGGVWGEVLSYPVQVDLTGPSNIVLREVDRSDPTDPRVAFAVEATDALSGIDYFMMGFDGEEPEKWTPTDDSVYKPDGLTPGEHVLLAIAYDKAGNSASSEIVFLVRSLESPTLKNESMPERVLAGDSVTVRGTTYPNAKVTTYISFNEGETTEKTVTSDELGDFIVTVTEGARAGKYTLWFTVEDERGAISPNSIRRSIDVSQPVIMLFGSIAVTYLSVIVPLVALILLLLLVLWLGYTWARGYRGRVRRETSEAYGVARDEFDSLRKELIKQIGMLERANQSRELTREEMRIFTDLSKRLDTIERHITEEIDDIEYVDGGGESGQVSEKSHSVEGALNKYREKLKTSDTTTNDTHVLRL